jgi:hypothetical protein
MTLTPAQGKRLMDAIQGRVRNLEPVSSDTTQYPKDTAGVTSDRSHPGLSRTTETGQNEVYLVLSTEERAKGFVRPYRTTYRHLKCNTTTRMSAPLSETYARKPAFYDSTFCCQCKTHFPVSEFRWLGTDEQVGS